MYWCFVHAPIDDGRWAGELVLALKKKKSKGKYKLSVVHTMISEMYPDDDPFEFDYKLDVEKEDVELYLKRKSMGMMQRESIVGSYEDMHDDEWDKSLRLKYPDIFFLRVKPCP